MADHRILAPLYRALKHPGFAGLFLAALVLGSAGTLLRFANHPSKPKTDPTATAKPNLSSISLPMFFEPNQGQTDPQVKFLARGSGYGLFLTANEAVLEVQSHAPSVETQLAASPDASQSSVLGSKRAAQSSKLKAPITSIIRMHLDGANPTAKIAGSDPLPGKSNYFIGNDPAKWRRDIPQYARVNYEDVYPGVDLVYYGNQGQLEYDFRVAPGANPAQIALKFDGASAQLKDGDLVLSTRAGDLRFHAPIIYQQDSNNRRRVEGTFRQLSNNEIGFAIGTYDHSRELVIDPTLFYSTWLGGGGETDVHVAVDGGFNIYVAGSTTSAAFPITPGAIQKSLAGVRNIFVSKISSPTPTGAQLLFSTYLGGNGTDTAAGVAVDSGGSIYVAGSTTSTTFPHTSNAFQPGPPAVAGTHGFLSKLSPPGNYSLSYSTYLAGNLGPNPSAGFDQVTGLAIDGAADAFVTGTTTSTDGPGNGFPANANGYQTGSNAAQQFFASKINTNGSGSTSMLYSTYFGGSSVPGGFPLSIFGGGIAVDTGGNMYFTGASNFIGGTPPTTLFPILNGQQPCLNEPTKTSGCSNSSGKLDAFVAKINPNIVDGAGLLLSTFLGGSGDDLGLAITVDSSSNPYVTGSTNSTDWINPAPSISFQANPGTNGDAFIAKLGPLASGIYPMAYFTYIGGGGTDVGEAIVVDSVAAAHVTGLTTGGLPVLDSMQGFGGGTDAFVGLISSTTTVGNYLSYLGGSGDDVGRGIAIDAFNATYVAGETTSGNFPVVNSLQTFASGQDAFVSKIINNSSFAYVATNPITVSPSPANMGTSVTFTFKWVNNGPEAANNVLFSGTLTGTAPGQGFSFSSATASPGGTCPNPVNGILTCNVGTVAASSDLTVTVVLVPTVQTPATTSLNVTPTLSANGGGFVGFQCPQPCPLPVPVDDFTVSAAPSTQSVTAGGSVSYTVTLTPINGPYTSQITMGTPTLQPSTSTITTSFTTNPVTISGTSAATTTLNLTTQARPVGSGSLWHRGPVYATWIPVGGLSLLGLGVGASRKRRRWIAGTLLGLIAAIILLQPACGNSSSNRAPSGGTPAGTYFITITGTSGSASHSANQVQLVVN